MKKRISKEAWSWALYDWANSAFSTTVITALFPIFFKSYWSRGTDVATSTFQLGTAHSLVSGVLAVLSPILGALADRASRKKVLVFLFAFLGVVSTGLLPLVAAGHWPEAILLFVIANVGFVGGNAIYDSLLVSVADRKSMDFVSAFGFSLGYLGGGLLFLLNVIMITKPELFGLADKVEATRISFFTVALWWSLFSIPLFLFVREPRRDAAASRGSLLRASIESLKQLAETLSHLRQHKYLGIFLLAYFFYIDGVNTIIKMSVDYGMSIGFRSESLILAILLVQFVGFPATLGFGWLAGRIGPKNSLFLCIGVYTLGTIYAFFMSSEFEFYILAGLIGLVQGGIQSISRAVFARMVPPAQAGEFFGFYNMLGKFSSILGPLLVGVVGLATQDPRYSILSVIVLFVIGAALLKKVPIAEPEPS